MRKKLFGVGKKNVQSKIYGGGCNVWVMYEGKKCMGEKNVWGGINKCMRGKKCTR